MSDELKLIGRLCYEAFQQARRNLLAPPWSELPESERRAWAASGVAIADEFKRRTQDVFYGFAHTW